MEFRQLIREVFNRTWPRVETDVMLGGPKVYEVLFEHVCRYSVANLLKSAWCLISYQTAHAIKMRLQIRALAVYVICNCIQCVYRVSQA